MERPDNYFKSSSIGWKSGGSTEFGDMKEPFGETTSDARRKRRDTDLGLIEGDNIVIPEGKWIVIDSQLPKLGNVIVYGGLEFGENIESMEMGSLLVLGGRVITTRAMGDVRTSPLSLTFHGTYEDTPIALGEGNVFGSKGIACYGFCEFLGTGPVNPWTVLTADVSAGETSLTVEDDVSDWPVGGVVILTSTAQDGLQTEDELQISAVSGKTLTLTSAVKFKHRGTVRLKQKNKNILIKYFNMSNFNARYCRPRRYRFPPSRSIFGRPKHRT